MKKIYCAGPLFNGKEKEEMSDIAEGLERAGYQVFLPHRDGFEFSGLASVFKEIGLNESSTNAILNRAIFTLDVFQVLDSDGLILNINGRVPDEGAMVEAGIAWNAGKEVVIYKNDARTLLNGSDNPLLLGLSDFNTVDCIETIPETFTKRFQKQKPGKLKIDNSSLNDIYERGKTIADLAKNGSNRKEVCLRLKSILGA
jgi:nucleoside 2-deoxyribosyltransferase